MVRLASAAGPPGSQGIAPASVPEAAATADGPQPAAGAETRRLLVVEDDYLVSLLISDLLDQAGYSVLGPMVTAEEAVELALAERPSLVLMDIRLGGEMDGIEAAIQLAEAGIRSLFVTAHSDPQTRLRGEAAGPCGWVEKPFADSQLLEAVAAALNR